MISRTAEALQIVQSKIGRRPDIALILGSGLGSLADSIENPFSIATSDLPGYPVSTVAGHSGQLIFGELEDKYVVFVKGRIHYYEGYSIRDIVFPISLLSALGIDRLLVTNAAGGSNPLFDPGTLMFIEDHINFGFANPLVGEIEVGPRFPDMSNPYDLEWLGQARRISTDLKVATEVGTYFWTPGPSYETPAEVKAYRSLGADAIGMSTVPEVTAARYYDMKVLGISTITNKAAGMSSEVLAHEDVLAVGRGVRVDLETLVRGIVKAL